MPEALGELGAKRKLAVHQDLCKVQELPVFTGHLPYLLGKTILTSAVLWGGLESLPANDEPGAVGQDSGYLMSMIVLAMY